MGASVWVCCIHVRTHLCMRCSEEPCICAPNTESVLCCAVLLLRQVWVLDSQPGTVPLDVDAPTSVGKIIQLIHSIPTPLSNRQELYRWAHTHKYTWGHVPFVSPHLSTHAQVLTHAGTPDLRKLK